MRTPMRSKRKGTPSFPNSTTLQPSEVAPFSFKKDYAVRIIEAAKNPSVPNADGVK